MTCWKSGWRGVRAFATNAVLALAGVATVSAFMTGGPDKAHAEFWTEHTSVSAEEMRRRTPAPRDPSGLREEMIGRVLQEVNQKRAEHGLGALRFEGTLNILAHEYSRDMLNRNFFGHVDPDGRSLDARVPASEKARISKIGENLWKGYGALDWTAGSLSRHAARNWMESPSHREAMLDPDYTETGVGVAIRGDQVYVTMLYARPKDGGGDFVASDFGTPPAPSPVVASSLESAAEQELLARRARIGVPALRRDSMLSTIARSYSERMIRENFFGLTTPEGENFVRRVQADNGRRFRRMAMSLWSNEGVSEWDIDQMAHRMVEKWMLDGSNFAHLAERRFTTFGVGVAVEKGRAIVVVIYGAEQPFGAPPLLEVQSGPPSIVLESAALNVQPRQAGEPYISVR